METFDFIMPIPPTDRSRSFQPVTEIALALGRHRNVQVLTDFLAKEQGGQQLENVEDPVERETLLKASLKIAGTYSIAGRSVLLLDDLYRSGATLSVATDLLLTHAKVSDVCVLTMTKSGASDDLYRPPVRLPKNKPPQRSGPVASGKNYRAKPQSRCG